MSCHPLLCLLSELAPRCRRVNTPYPLRHLSPSPSLSVLWKPPGAFPSLCACLLRVFSVTESRHVTPVWLLSVGVCFRGSFQVWPVPLLHSVSRLSDGPFYGILSVRSSQFICPSLDAQLSCFPLFALMGNVTINACVRVFMWIFVSSFVDICAWEWTGGSDARANSVDGSEQALDCPPRQPNRFESPAALYETSCFLQSLTYPCVWFFPCWWTRSGVLS